MSLKYMTYSIDPKTKNLVGSSSLTNQGMTWDETTVYTPKTAVYTQEQLNTSDWKEDYTNINYAYPDVSIIVNNIKASESFTWGYLPSDTFTKLNQERYNIFSVVYELVFINIDYFYLI